jgi:hypothetical protein
MAICGYNEKIGNGLSLLIEGMVDALEKKVAASTPLAVLANELVELDNINSVLRNAKGEVLPEMFVGLNLLAKALFNQVQHELETSGGEDLGSGCREVGNRFNDLLAQTERKNEELQSRLVGNRSVAERAQDLAKWALEQSRLCDEFSSTPSV